ncbi:hepatitis A virus cellular receptor 1 homolog [Chanos chanos]|uniref:Hepatitis A virus cellular receptor 1 homolog n=1 Tax=Chanos chanos TaxID=29144 RepID=A0A6J2W491_CHACN|nr:hepatitis A virus cellular receptor 1 homolog [Chanos chanos]
MDVLNSWLFSVWLLFLLTVHETTGHRISGTEGKNVTLPCKYDYRYHGHLTICWMRGEIPATGCGDQIISTDGKSVTWRKSEKYQLSAKLQHGDVSMTILNVRLSDSGIYGCRVHVPGWFNDEKTRHSLTVEKAPVPTQKDNLLTSSVPEETTQTQTINSTQDYHPFNETDPTSIPSPQYIEDAPASENPNLAVIVPVVAVMLTVIAMLILLIWRQQKKGRKSSEIHQQSDMSIIYSNSDSTMGLYSREAAIENVYQLEDTEEPVYQCP